MIDVNLELLSRYADSEVTPEERAAVDAAVAADPALAAQLDEFLDLAGLFGLGEPDEVSDALRERLLAIRPVPALERFEALPAAVRARRFSWWNVGFAAAAAVLLAVGVARLTYRPEVTVRDFARFVLGADGSVVQTFTDRRRTLRTGDGIETGAGERISFRLDDGSAVTLQPESRLELGDPRDLGLFDLQQGTVLCSVPERGQVRSLGAGPFILRMDRADFGVRVEGVAARTAGLSGGPPVRVTVAVSRGRLEIGENGSRETVAEDERLTLLRGSPARRTPAFGDPLYQGLMEQRGYEVVPGYFNVERGVRPIGRDRWDRQPDGTLVNAISDTVSLAGSTHLVLHVRAVGGPTALDVTRIRPAPDRPGEAEAAVVRTAVVGPDWTVVAVPRAAFDAPGAERETRKISASVSRLVRIELRPAETGASIELRASLWAARPPLGADPEVIR